MMLRMLLAVAWIAGATAWPSPALAEEPETPGSDQTPALEDGPIAEVVPSAPMEHPSLHGTLSLSLADAIRMGLENNLDVQVARFSPLIAGEQEGIAWGAYDPEFFGDIDYANTETPTAFLFSQEIKERPSGAEPDFAGASRSWDPATPSSSRRVEPTRACRFSNSLADTIPPST